MRKRRSKGVHRLGQYTIKVYRYNPAADDEPTYNSYLFKFEHHPTILEVLRKIRDEYDPTLAFRESCGLGKCGSCAVSMNGNPVLACRNPIEEEALIEPLANQQVIKDLVVERTEFHDRLRESRAFHNRPDYLKLEDKPFQWSDRFMDLSRCIKCLICESACPAFAYNSSDFPGPAFFVQLSRSLNHPLDLGREEHVAWVDGIHNCTACMICEHVCPKDVNPFRNGILALRSAISEKELELPMMQQGLADQYTKTGSVVPMKQNKLEHPAVDDNSKTAVFLGCMFTDRYPTEGKKVLNLLMAMGIKVQMPDGLVCCGGPLMWVGDRKQADEAFETNIKALVDSKVDRVITPCPGCGLTLKKDYSDYYRAKTGKEMPFEIIDMTELLGGKLNDISLEESQPVKVAYHSPCHHGKGQGLLNESLAVLEAISGVELVETKATNMCCGGMTSSSNSSMTLELSSRIIKEVESTRADTLVTSCIFCRDNLNRAARYRGSKIKVVHILSLVNNQVKNYGKGRDYK